MNLFNCFQATAFYSGLPFLITWAVKSDMSWLAIMAGIVMLIGYVLISIAVHEAAGK